MSNFKVELIVIGEETFDEMIDFETVQLMMQSEYVTVAGNTIRVNYKEVTSDGIVRFKGERI